MFDTLLKGLKGKDFDSLIKQERLRHLGYRLHFLIDANVIQNYCYPKGLDEDQEDKKRYDHFRKSKLTDAYIDDEQLTLYSIFKLGREHDKVIFLNEYVDELKGMIKSAKDFGKEVGKESFEFASNIRHNISSEEIHEKLVNDFSRFVAKILLFKNGIQKASELFHDRSVIFESEDFDDAFLKDATDSTLGVEGDIVEIYDIMYKVWKDLKKRTSEEEISQSKGRDAHVINRILLMNNFAQESKSNDEYQDPEKNIFILLTDSHHDISTMRKLAGAGVKNEVSYPLIDGRRVDLSRSVSQTFAFLISRSYKENGEVDYNGTVRNLENLKSFSKQVQDQFNETQRRVIGNREDLFFSKDYGDLFKGFRTLRNQLENIGLLRNFNAIYASLKETMQKLKANEMIEFFELAKADLKKASEILESDYDGLLTRLKDEATFTTTFVNAIDQLKKGNLKFELTKGSDYVEGSYQHLPIFLTSTPNSQIRKSIQNLMLLVLNRQISDSTQLCDELEQLLDAMKESRTYSKHQLEIKLIKAFIFMILPDVKYTSEEKNENPLVQKRDRDNDSVAYKWLTYFQDQKQEDLNLDSDLRYMICWIVRRIGNYKKAIKIAEEAMLLYPEDPRFLHGKLLAEFCHLQDGNDQIRLEHIDPLIKGLREVKLLYGPFVKAKFPDFDTNLILSKISDTYNNTNCYFITLKAYLFDKEKRDPTSIRSLLRNARALLELVKDNGVFHDQLPEYFDTEAHLEYMESFYFDEPISKLTHAREAILRAMVLSNHKGLISKYQARLEEIELRKTELEKKTN